MENIPGQNFADKLKDSIWWWLGFKRPFIINNHYKLELLHIDREHNSVKIKITNLKTDQVSSVEMSDDR